MTATELISGTVSREELHVFHLTGRGLDRLRLMGRLTPAAAPELPPLESVYPVLLAAGKAPQPRAGAGDPVPGPERLAGFHASALPLLYGGFLAAGRADARARFLRELRQSVTDLQDLLAVDDAKLSQASPDRVAASLGADASRFLSVSRLMALRGRRPVQPSVMAPERRRRCEAALAILEEAVRRQPDSPAFWLVHSDGVHSGEGESMELGPVGGRGQHSTDPCADALALCNRQLTEGTPVLRAVRIAKLEAHSAYDPVVHDEALERFDWQAAEPWEIAAIPAVIALESAARLSLHSFSRMLLSDRPVQVLIPWSEPGAPEPAAPEPGAADPGAVALAHRGAFVLQASMARWDHLSKGFAEMVQVVAPAVAVVAIPPAEDDASAAWREASLLARSQAFPLYRYDPDRGGEWADRFELGEVDLGGLEALVLAARFRDEVRAIPPEARDEGLMELGEYLKRQQAVPPFTLPFVRVADEAGNTQRVALSRGLVRLCRDRSRAWEMLAALAARPGLAREKITPAADSAAIRKAVAKEACMLVVALLADQEKLARRT